MTSVMKLLGWKAEGLRCPDHEIDCCDEDGNPYPVSLIQMPNGTGKTTTLTLLRAALAGSARDGGWDESSVRSVQKRAEEHGSGSFEVRLLLNGRRVTIIMSFDFESGRVFYKTTRGAGQVDNFDPPAEFRRFLNDRFVRFFVFDGELAHNLLDRQQVDAEAVVETLFQVNALQVLARRVRDYWTHLTRNVSATEERGLARRRNRVDNLQARLRVLVAEQKRLRQLAKDLQEKIDQQHETYNMEIRKEEAQSRELEEAQEKADDLTGRTREEALGVLDHMRDPQALSPYFAQAMYELKLGLDRVKLPESAAREFFEELATEENCVCGRPIDEEISAVIRERASEYLSSDDVSLLNSMKSAIQDSVGVSRVQSEIELTGELRELEILVARRRDSFNELDELHLLAEQGDPAVKRASEVIKDLDAKLAIINQDLEKYNSTESASTLERTFSISVVADWLEEAEQLLAEITETLEMRDKRDILVKIIEDARERASALINAEICADANDRIGRLMPDNRIFIERIDKALILHGQEGGSAGETLSVAYAFLATLFNRSDHELPFVVDSPAGPIDLAIRPRIGELIPRLTDQFVAFTISSEREGFVPRLKEAANGNVQFITLFRKGTPVPGNVVGNRLVETETADGVVVKGEEFFNAFQLDIEVS